MTEDEKKKMLAGFEKPAQDDVEDGYWTDERLIEMAKRIIERLGLDGELQ